MPFNPPSRVNSVILYLFYFLFLSKLPFYDLQWTCCKSCWGLGTLTSKCVLCLCRRPKHWITLRLMLENHLRSDLLHSLDHKILYCLCYLRRWSPYEPLLTQNCPLHSKEKQGQDNLDWKCKEGGHFCCLHFLSQSYSLLCHRKKNN